MPRHPHEDFAEGEVEKHEPCNAEDKKNTELGQMRVAHLPGDGGEHAEADHEHTPARPLNPSMMLTELATPPTAKAVKATVKGIH